jgi:hypothetical protein
MMMWAGCESGYFDRRNIGWCSTARTVRARVLQLREAPFMEALAALGFTRTRIVVCHLLPNLSDVVSAKFVLSVAGAMLSEAALSFMGLGDPVRTSWGRMMHFAFQRGGRVRQWPLELLPAPGTLHHRMYPGVRFLGALLGEPLGAQGGAGVAGMIDGIEVYPMPGITVAGGINFTF